MLHVYNVVKHTNILFLSYNLARILKWTKLKKIIIISEQNEAKLLKNLNNFKKLCRKYLAYMTTYIIN